MGNRPTDWHVLDLDDDPTPGDPERVKQLARELHDFADDVADALRQIKGMAGEDALLRWAGKTAKAFQDEFEEVPKNLKKLQRSYDLAGDALAAYWPKLERAQSLADRALARGREAQSDLTAANGRLDSADSWVERATKKTEEYDEKEGKDKPDESEVRAAARNATDAKSAQSSAQRAVDNAESGLEAAKKMAADAKKMREDAASEAKDKLEEASDAGIQNRKWWEKAVDWVKDNWDTIVNVCKVIVAVLGIVVLIIGGPLAWVVLAAALVVLADTLYKYMNGEASLWDVALAALDCIPGMKGLTTLGGLAKMAKGGMKAMKGLKAMKAGILGLAKSGRTMLSSAAKGALNRLKSVVSKLTDPVDLATGQMYLPQTDIELPGLLPLAFTRRLGSTYRCGWWFGPTWASTVDQRLETDETGIVFVTEDGRLLAYPHPAGPDDQVSPESGPRWPLTRRDDGGYVILDPLTGHTRHFYAADPDGLALLRQITDRNGHTITFTYDPDSGAPTDITHSGGYHLRLTTTEDRVTALHLARAGEDGTDVEIKRFGYDADGNLTEDYNSSGLPLRFTYDERLRVTSWTDRTNHSYRYTYDAQDRCVAEGGEAGHLSVSIDYDGTDPAWPDATVTTLTTAEGHATRFVINDNSQVIAEVSPQGHITRTEYDENHNLLSWTDPLGNVTRSSPNAAGQPLSLTYADGTTTRFGYDERGSLTSVSRADGATWRRSYDERGNLTAAEDPGGAVTRYTYDEQGRLTGIVNPAGTRTAVRCNAAGLQLELTDPLGNTVRRERDAFGRVTQVIDAAGARTRLWWTVEGAVTLMQGPDGARESREYDADGNCVRHVDARGNATAYEYTHFDLLAARTDPDGARYEFSYDAALRRTAVTDPYGRDWSFAYDADGRMIAETDFDGGRTGYSYDAGGRVTSRTNAVGQTVSFEHDALGRITAKQVEGARTSFTYDLAGQLQCAVSPHTEARWERDTMGRPLVEEVDGRITTHAYDTAGRRTRRVTPAGVRSAWGYDAAGRVTSLRTSGRLIEFDIGAAGRESARRIGETLSLQFEHDPAGRVTRQRMRAEGTEVVSRGYSYRSDGRLKGIDDPLLGDTSLDFDAVGRITGVHAPKWREAYAYDLSGNQEHAEWPGPGAPEARGARAYSGSRLTRAGGMRYLHDAAGRVVEIRKKRISHRPDVWHLRWDAEDRLTGVVTPDGTRFRYLYDPLGRRTAKQRLAPGDDTVVEETRFSWDGLTLAEETSTGRGRLRDTTLTWDYDGLRPVAQTERLTDSATQEETDERFFAIVTDLVGTPTELVAEDGVPAWRARRTAWGVTAWNAGATAYTPLRFPGQYLDAETGLHYNVFRYYDPQSSRYVTPDPLGLAPAANPFAYVADPTGWTDPFGLSPYKVMLGIDSPAFRKLADREGFETLMGYSTKDAEDMFMMLLWGKQDVKWAVNLDNFAGANPRDMVMQAVQVGARPGMKNSITQWEMAQLWEKKGLGRYGDGTIKDVDFYLDGSKVKIDWNS